MWLQPRCSLFANKGPRSLAVVNIAPSCREEGVIVTRIPAQSPGKMENHQLGWCFTPTGLYSRCRLDALGGVFGMAAPFSLQ